MNLWVKLLAVTCSGVGRRSSIYGGAPERIARITRAKFLDHAHFCIRDVAGIDCINEEMNGKLCDDSQSKMGKATS